MNFIANKKEYTLNILEDGEIEIYETDDVINTGFVFSDRNHFVYFINKITDFSDELPIVKRK
jgi:hypothetical protein